MMTLPQDAPDPVRQQKAREYSKLSRRLLFLELGIGAILLLVLLFTGASTRLVGFLPFASPWSAALYLLILVLGYGIMVAPLGYYQDFVLPQRYGLSTQNVIGWLKDKAKSLPLGLLLGLCLVTVIYWLMERLPSLWWLAVGLIMFLLTLFLTWLAPTLLISLFFKLEPLKEGELKERLANLARRAKVDVKDVFSMNLSSKATTANAMLSGWGKSRRVIISDTLLQSYSFDEIEVTLAHELGHHIHHDIPKLMLIRTVAFLLAFYLTSLALTAGVVLFSFQGISDVAGFPWLVLVLAVFMLILQPLLNWYNRRIELAADEAALKLSNNPQAFIGLMTKLTDQNLIEAEPGKWTKILFYDHPSYGGRVKLAHKSIQQSASS
ncbi:MAG: M48 family metallopeptidase [Dehalococcoidia bacterium]|nr:M48 family metallopeptidase [Dehalococcoidia bacterium]